MKSNRALITGQLHSSKSTSVETLVLDDSIVEIKWWLSRFGGKTVITSVCES